MEASHVDSGKSQSQRRNDSAIILQQTAGKYSVDRPKTCNYKLVKRDFSVLL